MKLLRIEYNETGIGMWSTRDSKDVPLVAQLTNQVIANLPMPDSDIYRTDGKKWYSCCATLEGLRSWFSESDIQELLDLDFIITTFDSPLWIELAKGEFIFPKENITNFQLLTIGDIY
jgi:hypothetical protein